MRFSAFVALRLFAVLFLKRFPAGVLAACSASRAARFGSDAGKNPCGWHGKDQSTTRRDRRSEAFVLDLSRSHPAGVSRGKGKKKHTAKSPGCAPLPPLPQSVPACESVAPGCACVRIRRPVAIAIAIAIAVAVAVASPWERQSPDWRTLLAELALKIRHENRLRARFELSRFPQCRIPLLPRLFLSPHRRQRISPRLVPCY